jgi:flavodoxin
MKKFATFLLLITFLFSTACSNAEQRQTELPQSSESTVSKTESENNTMIYENGNSNILIAYFSATGTTKQIAEYTSEILDADVYEIVPAVPYTAEDLAYYTNGRADREQNDPSVRPAISGSIENMEQYDTILLGYPIWHGQAPRIISTFLESYDFSGKTILPFCTSHSSGIGSSDINLHALAENATWLDGRRFSAGASKDEIASWLDEMGISQSISQKVVVFN